MDRALRLLGIGGAQIVVVSADGQGRMDPEGLRTALSRVDGPTIVCAQEGEVNTGAYDSFTEIAEIVSPTEAWLHIDGAFGLWAEVLFRFADDETTNAILAHVQASGEAWMGGTTWDGRSAIRLSVSNWRTTEDDIALTVAAFEHAASSQ